MNIIGEIEKKIKEELKRADFGHLSDEEYKQMIYEKSDKELWRQIEEEERKTDFGHLSDEEYKQMVEDFFEDQKKAESSGNCDCFREDMSMYDREGWFKVGHPGEKGTWGE